MPASKRQKLSDNVDDERESDGDGPDTSGEGSEDDSNTEQLLRSESDSNSPDTADEIAGVKWTKSKKTSKRKIRATKTSQFGSTLQFLLNTDTPSTLPLSLKPSIARKRNDERLELKVKKVLQVEKKEKEDKGRIRDVIGGWGGESERALRKVAQRGGKIYIYIHIYVQGSNATIQWSNFLMLYSNPKPLLPASPKNQRL
jgi:hypothetical protein